MRSLAVIVSIFFSFSSFALWECEIYGAYIENANRKVVKEIKFTRANTNGLKRKGSRWCKKQLKNNLSKLCRGKAEYMRCSYTKNNGDTKACYKPNDRPSCPD